MLTSFVNCIRSRLLALTILSLAFLISGVSAVYSDTDQPITKTKNNYARPFEPPTKPAFVALPPGAVEPQGWLRDWCMTVKDGYTSRMDDVDIAFRQSWAADYTLADERISLWETGGWPYEGGGYWFEAMAKMGFLLHDRALIDQAKKRLDVVVDNMNDHSIAFMWWLDKNKPHDLKIVEGRGLREPETPMWYNGLMGRSMAGYYAATGEDRILKTMETAYSGSRDWVGLGVAMSNPWPAFETYTWTGNPVIKDAISAVFAREPDEKKPWSWDRYRRFPNDKPGGEAPSHGVIFCESSAPWALGYLWTGKREFLDAPLAWYAMIERDCMQPHGVPVFDEYWGPTGAFRGTETCDVAAYIWSQNLMLAVGGDGQLADRIERAFFNAGPATLSRDCTTHVYFQSPNRMADKALPAADMFTYMLKRVPLCCTTTLNRILPNYVINMWMATQDGGLAAVCYGPCKVSALAADRMPVELDCRTAYPFDETIEIAVKPSREASFPLQFRIPGWCKAAALKINGTESKASPDADGFVRVERLWKPGDVVSLRFPMSPHIATGKDANAADAPYATVSYGPLLFSLPIADQEPNAPDAAAKWRYALDTSADSSDAGITVEHSDMPAKWDWPLQSPLRLRVSAMPIDWQPTLEKPLPLEPFAAKETPEQLTLVPYGCTKFRISMFPVTRKTLKQEKIEKE
jgi:hypothetical protein